MSKPKIEIYTDGSCGVGDGGWAFLILGSEIVDEFFSNSDLERFEDGYLGKGSWENTTNNQMEFTAIGQAIKAVVQNCTEPVEVTIFTDSQYCIDCLTNWWYGWDANQWKKRDGEPVKNQNYIKRILDLTNFFEGEHEYSFEWVKGHNGNKYNEIVDTWAYAEMLGNREYGVTEVLKM